MATQLAQFTVPLMPALLIKLLWGPMTVTSILVSFALGVSLYRLISDIRWRHNTRSIFTKGNIPILPGGNPITGHAQDLFLGENFGALLLEREKELGQTFGLLYGPDPWIYSTDLDLIHKVFVTDSNKHPNLADLRPPNFSPISESILTARDNNWRAARRSINPSFLSKLIKSENEVREREDSCNKFLNHIESLPEKAGGKVADVLHDFTAFTMDVIFKLILNRPDYIQYSPNERNKFVDAELSAFESLVGPLVCLSVPYDWPKTLMGYLTKFTEFGSFTQLIDSIFVDSMKRRNRAKLEAARDNGGSDKLTWNNKLIDVLINWPNDPKTKHLNRHAHLFFVFAAGFGTSAGALTAMFWMLGKYQHIQDKLRQAIISEGVDASYLDWCIKETLRLYPSVPATGRILGEDVTTSDGKTLFKGTTLVVSVYCVHRKESLWGPDVDEFRPERFSEPLAHENQFFGFGAGPRGCVGKHLAMQEIKELTSRLLTTYRIEHCDTTPKELECRSPNLVHLCYKGPIDLKFVKLSFPS